MIGIIGREDKESIKLKSFTEIGILEGFLYKKCTTSVLIIMIHLNAWGEIYSDALR